MKSAIFSRWMRIAATVALAGCAPVLAQASNSVAQQAAMQRLHQPLNVQPALMSTNQFGMWRLDIGAGQSDAGAEALRASQNSTSMETMVRYGTHRQNLAAEGQSAAVAEALRRIHDSGPV